MTRSEAVKAVQDTFEGYALEYGEDMDEARREVRNVLLTLGVTPDELGTYGADTVIIGPDVPVQVVLAVSDHDLPTMSVKSKEWWL